jgi:hypothetical protein
MSSGNTAYVRCLAFFDTYRKDRGQPPSLDVDVPADGITVLALTEALGLPADKLDGAFLNYRNTGADAVVRPGDRVALVPVGTPASHPAFFGPFITRE